MTLTLQYILDALDLGFLYALIALGIALVFGVMRLVNFAHGAMIMVGAYVVVLLAPRGWLLAFAGAIVAVVLLGLVIERVAFRPMRETDPTTLLITSFCVAYVAQNGVSLATSGAPETVSLPSFLSSSFLVGGLQVQYLQLITVGAAILLLLALVFFLRRTVLGTQMRAAAENFRMTRLLGVPANRVIGVAFAISGCLAGVVSILLVSQSGLVTPTMGVQPLLVGFVATVIGGLGSLIGAAAGGFLLGVLTVALQVGLPSGVSPFRDAFVFAGVIALLIFKPQGLLGKAEL